MHACDSSRRRCAASASSSRLEWRIWSISASSAASKPACASPSSARRLCAAFRAASRATWPCVRAASLRVLSARASARSRAAARIAAYCSRTRWPYTTPSVIRVPSSRRLPAPTAIARSLTTHSAAASAAFSSSEIGPRARAARRARLSMCALPTRSATNATPTAPATYARRPLPLARASLALVSFLLLLDLAVVTAAALVEALAFKGLAAGI